MHLGFFFFPLPCFSSAMQKIRACNSSEEDLLGSDRCAWGPHYWCKNMATAIECHVSIGHVPSPGLAGCWGSLPPPTILPHLSRRLLSTASVTCGTRSHLPGQPGLPCRFGSGSRTPSLAMLLRPWMVTTGAHRPHHPGGGCRVPQPPLLLPFPPLELGFPNQVKGLVSIFRTGDSALMSLRATAKSPSPSSSPSPFSPHTEPLLKPRSCNVDPSPWAGTISAAQMSALGSWPPAALHLGRGGRSHWLLANPALAGPSSNWGGFLLFFFPLVTS